MDVRVKRGEMTGEIDKGRTVICTRSITEREPVLRTRERERERISDVVEERREG